ncbi:hypothetical protein [Microbacterium sp. ZOR0019]|uniref:hypothetical protein n=1 Tax=Microbacterium sp. ZOR0019 TaxID=1339233 RepID=UPI0012E05BDE|nr:hypothetical protein [Microbacterium sp. ZOR0019]
MTIPTPPPLDTPMPSSGEHRLPVAFWSTPPPLSPPAQRKNRRGLILGLVGGVAVIAALSITQVAANLGYDNAASRYAEAAETASTAKTEVRSDITELRDVTDAAEQILSVEQPAVAVDAELGAALTTASEEAEIVAVSAEEIVAIEVPSSGEKPVWFWELFGATTLLEQHLASTSRLSDDLRTVTTEIATAGDGVSRSGVALLATAGEAAAGFEKAHLSARNDAVIALRDAAADAAATTTLDAAAATTYLSLQGAAAEVVATEAQELAEKAGPLQNARLEIEAFARSLAPGVLLEFDWAPVVNGAGYNGSMGGYTTWWWDDPDRAIIELSNSVAEQWPAERSKALVAHEVGHAISVKCEDMYDASTQDSIEKWATAWAISMGYTDDANGVWAYGYPPQEYIDAAAGCR